MAGLALGLGPGACLPQLGPVVGLAEAVSFNSPVLGAVQDFRSLQAPVSGSSKLQLQGILLVSPGAAL